MSTSQNAIGLMSGTSLDGVDVAMITTDGIEVSGFGPASTVSYTPEFRERLRSVLGGVGAVGEVEEELTRFHAQVIDGFLQDNCIDPENVDVIGFHGHTILHQPENRKTWQIGDGALLASLSGRPVVCDFRSADVAAGGHGAPLVPVFHQAMSRGLETPLAVLNVGGVANITWIGPNGTILAFDTGPGNALIDDWVLRHTGRSYDENGTIAASGIVDPAKVQAFLSHPFFAAKPPKSLDRDDFAKLAQSLVHGMTAENGAATLTAFTVSSVEAAYSHCPMSPKRWLVTGGGRHNTALMQALQRGLSAPVEAVEQIGWNGDALEAQAFGFLAVRSLKGMPLTFPETTGSLQPLTGGRIFKPE
jgi:anhydro-N-acetylmuramic acid kinase